MCRLFGFRSVIKSQVHRSLVQAENALAVQSPRHPDGWGVAYYVGGVPHLIKAPQLAISDSIFRRISGVVASETVVAHVRHSTCGTPNILNTHPFQHGRWVFAHNGNVRGFADQRARILSGVAPELRRFILGETDSEAIFFLFLSRLASRVPLAVDDVDVSVVMDAMSETVQDLIEKIGPWDDEATAGDTGTYLTFLVTNGTTMVAHQGGKPLRWSSWKEKCPDRDTCPCYSAECENPSETGFINHLIFSSEPLDGDNIWQEMSPGQMLGVGREMKLEIRSR